MQVSPTQLAEPEITSVGSIPFVTEQEVNVKMILTTLRKSDESSALESLQLEVRDASSILNTKGLVTHSSRAHATAFVASCELRSESKKLYVTSSTSGCIDLGCSAVNLGMPRCAKQFKLDSPSTKATSNSLHWLPEPRTAEHATTCNTGLSL